MNNYAVGCVPVSVMIFTLNEEIHLPGCLDSLQWCDDIIVVDSFSSDRTEAICQERGVRFYQHRFEGFGRQRNWAFDHVETKYDWVLVLDADERVPEALAVEMVDRVAQADDTVGAFQIRRRFYMWGRWLRYSSLYPSWVVRLVHKNKVRYINRGHAETQRVEGEILSLDNDLIDENRRGIEAWFERQNRYSTKEAEYEREQEKSPINWSHLWAKKPLHRRALLKRLAMRLPCRALVYFLYSYFFRRGFLDGRDGLVFCLMKAQYQQMIAVKKYDMGRLGRNPGMPE